MLSTKLATVAASTPRISTIDPSSPLFASFVLESTRPPKDGERQLHVRCLAEKQGRTASILFCAGQSPFLCSSDGKTLMLAPSEGKGVVLLEELTFQVEWTKDTQRSKWINVSDGRHRGRIDLNLGEVILDAQKRAVTVTEDPVNQRVVMTDADGIVTSVALSRSSFPGQTAIEEVTRRYPDGGQVTVRSVRTHPCTFTPGTSPFNFSQLDNVIGGAGVPRVENIEEALPRILHHDAVRAAATPDRHVKQKQWFDTLLPRRLSQSELEPLKSATEKVLRVASDGDAATGIVLLSLWRLEAELDRVVIRDAGTHSLVPLSADHVRYDRWTSALYFQWMVGNENAVPLDRALCRLAQTRSDEVAQACIALIARLGPLEGADSIARWEDALKERSEDVRRCWSLCRLLWRTASEQDDRDWNERRLAGTFPGSLHEGVLFIEATACAGASLSQEILTRIVKASCTSEHIYARRGLRAVACIPESEHVLLEALEREPVPENVVGDVVLPLAQRLRAAGANEDRLLKYHHALLRNSELQEATRFHCSWALAPAFTDEHTVRDICERCHSGDSRWNWVLLSVRQASLANVLTRDSQNRLLAMLPAASKKALATALILRVANPDVAVGSLEMNLIDNLLDDADSPVCREAIYAAWLCHQRQVKLPDAVVDQIIHIFAKHDDADVLTVAFLTLDDMSAGTLSSQHLPAVGVSSKELKSLGTPTWLASNREAIMKAMKAWRTEPWSLDQQRTSCTD